MTKELICYTSPHVTASISNMIDMPSNIPRNVAVSFEAFRISAVTIALRGIKIIVVSELMEINESDLT